MQNLIISNLEQNIKYKKDFEQIYHVW
jgi:hypothetical protein